MSVETRSDWQAKACPTTSQRGVIQMSVETAINPVSAGVSPSRGPATVIRKAAVLGAGTMGSRIAAHLANAGLPVVLLDIPAPAGARSAIASQALEALKKNKPAAFYDPAYAAHISVGNFEDDLALLAGCDWVIEAVTENLAIKQALLDKVVPHLMPGAILTTNTSGLPVASNAAKLPEAVRRRWFGTHFFNPPRYMRLVEIIPTPEADPAAIAAIAHFADVLLGKEVVFARDTPNFIANRIGVFIMLESVRLMQEEDLTIEEVDALTGSVIGWPRAGGVRLGGKGGVQVLGAGGGELRGRGRARCRRSSRRCWSAVGWEIRPIRVSTRRRRTPRARRSAWCWIGRRWNTFRPSEIGRATSELQSPCNLVCRLLLE